MQRHLPATAESPTAMQAGYLPHYTLGQDDHFVVVSLTLPHVWLERFDMKIRGCEFSFELKPYELHLHFHQRLSNDARQAAAYDWDRCQLVLYIPKVECGRRYTLKPSASLPRRTSIKSEDELSSDEVREVDEEAFDFDDDDFTGSEVPSTPPSWMASASSVDAEGQSARVVQDDGGDMRPQEHYAADAGPVKLTRCPSRAKHLWALARSVVLDRPAGKGVPVESPFLDDDLAGARCDGAGADEDSDGRDGLPSECQPTSECQGLTRCPSRAKYLWALARGNLLHKEGKGSRVDSPVFDDCDARLCNAGSFASNGRASPTALALRVITPEDYDGSDHKARSTNPSACCAGKEEDSALPTRRASCALPAAKSLATPSGNADTASASICSTPQADFARCVVTLTALNSEGEAAR